MFLYLTSVTEARETIFQIKAVCVVLQHSDHASIYMAIAATCIIRQIKTLFFLGHPKFMEPSLP